MTRLLNERTGKVVVQKLEEARSFSSRLRGLLGRSDFPEGHGLFFEGTNSIHTFFMRFPIDVVFLDHQGVVKALVHDLKPWRVVLPVWNAKNCLELPAGTLQRTEIEKGDKLRAEAEGP
jgi:uncharacterized membrane protein (UPF0127 family)